MWLYLHVYCGWYLTLHRHGLRDGLGPGAQVADHAVHGRLVPQEEWPDDAIVQDLGAVPRHWRHAPHKEHTLGGGRGSRDKMAC